MEINLNQLFYSESDIGDRSIYKVSIFSATTL